MLLFLIFFNIDDIKNANMTHKMSDNLNIKELSQKADQLLSAIPFN